MNTEFTPPRHQLWKKTFRQLDIICERMFSRYIRMKNADHRGYVKCFTCSKIMHWSEMQCGHYVSRRNMCAKYLEINNNPQCHECNVIKYGNLDRYRRNIDKVHGAGMAEYIEEIGHKTCKYTKIDFIDLITELERWEEKRK